MKIQDSAASLQPRFTGLVDGAMQHAEKGLRSSVLGLEENTQLGLVFTDLAGMTIPRTTIEWKKRGAFCGQETFFREFTCVLANTFMTGWLGNLAYRFLRSPYLNPLGMDHKAWIDAKSLSAYQDVLKELMASSKINSSLQLQKAFLQTVFQRLQSTDAIAKLSSQELKNLGVFDFSHYFPDKGMFSKAHVDQLVETYLHGYPSSGKDNSFTQRAFNVEELVHNRIKDTVYQHEVDKAVHKATAKFLEERPAKLSANEKMLLSFIQTDARSKALEEQKLAVRRLIRRGIFIQEKPFMKALYDFAVTEGKMSDHVSLLDAKGGRLVSQSMSDWLSKTKYFMEEFLNRTLADPTSGRIPAKTLPLDRIKRQLLAKQKGVWAFVSPKASDDLLTYAYRSKFFISVIPLAIMTSFGFSMVYINNWLTRRRTGGRIFFPGEEALLEQERRQHQKGGTKPTFGHAPYLLKKWDFENLGTSTVGQSKFIYTWIILSRWWKARTWNELRENMRRDALGWYFWFMGSPLMQIGLATLVVPQISPAAKHFILSKIPTHNENPFQQLTKAIINPYNVWHIASDKQIAQRKEQILSAMKAQGKNQVAMNSVKKLFETTRMLRTTFMSTFGIAFSTAMIGIGIMFINIALTRKDVRKNRLGYTQPPPETPSPQPFRKPEYVTPEYSAA